MQNKKNAPNSSVPKFYSTHGAMKPYMEDFHKTMKLADRLLSPLNQGVLSSSEKTGFFRMLLRLWAIWYNCAWVAFYFYLIFGERAGLAIVSEQIWCLMSVMQLLAKLINGVVQRDKLKELLKWCEGVYTTKYKPDYEEIFEKTCNRASFLIYLCSRSVIKLGRTFLLIRFNRVFI